MTWQQLLTARKKTDIVPVSGVPAAAWPWLVANVRKQRDSTAPLLVVAPDAAHVPTLMGGITAVLGEPVLEFPAWDVQPYDRVGPSAEVSAWRQEVLSELAAGFNGVVVTSMAALGVREAPLMAGGAALPELRVGAVVHPTKVVQELVNLGFSREALVQGRGQFAVRGGIVDVWPGAAAAPCRLEWLDDELESVRLFEPVSQKSLEDIKVCKLGGTGQVVLDAATVARFRQRYLAQFAGGSVDEVYVNISNGIWVPEAGQLLPLFYAAPLVTLFDVLPATTQVILPANLVQQAEGFEEVVQAAQQHRAQSDGGRALAPELLFVSAAEMLGKLKGYQGVQVDAFDGADGVHLPLRAQVFALNNRHLAAQAAAKAVQQWQADGWTVTLTATTAPGLAQFLRALEGEGMPAPRLLPAFDLVSGRLSAAAAGLAAGWTDADRKVAVLTEADVFGMRVGGTAARRRRANADELLATLSELRAGDYVVHEAHGVARFGGLETLHTGGVVQDYLKLFYADDDRLFVPVENIQVLSRYKGADAGAVVLDKLGTGGWETRKAKVKADLLAMADELLATAAARELVEREPVSRGGPGMEGLYDEFCAGFPYPLTEDQERVLAEVETDLLAGVPMDRLVVGDVGFGKTEVALRAAFMVAASGKQVAVICPTTLLARQHYAVFAERFKGFPMRLGRLSRLVDAKETKATRAGLADGTLDIVVGTHALLGKEVNFAKLGLVVVDEEQRFGVAHKEKLKQVRVGTDILTLTATPIPRTLQLAVGGVRQLSLITTPPVDRHAVATQVLRWDNVTLQGAMTRELMRGGQVYVVAPHVEDLPRLAQELQQLVPDASLGVAHGQLPEAELERVMVGFYEGELQILLATTIIESGLDVPRANTLIVYRADRFGLAQLYQLRGRVGRSTRQAYAYFILPEGNMGGDAAKRLEILRRLDGLGAGFQLASYDMDLRGFGNLLGKEQSGNIRDIGFELYTKLLREAVQTKQRAAAQKRHAPSPEVLQASTVSLKLGVSYLLPEAFVPEVGVRLQLYRRLAALTNPAEVADFAAELADRFGAVPPEVQALLQVVNLRNRAAALNVNKIEVGEKGVVVGFERGKFVNPAGLVGLMQRLAGVVVIRPVTTGPAQAPKPLRDGQQELVWHRRLGTEVLAGVGKILAELEAVAGADVAKPLERVV